MMRTSARFRECKPFAQSTPSASARSPTTSSWPKGAHNSCCLSSRWMTRLLRLLIGRRGSVLLWRASATSWITWRLVLRRMLLRRGWLTALSHVPQWISLVRVFPSRLPSGAVMPILLVLRVEVARPGIGWLRQQRFIEFCGRLGRVRRRLGLPTGWGRHGRHTSCGCDYAHNRLLLVRLLLGYNCRAHTRESGKDDTQNQRRTCNFGM